MKEPDLTPDLRYLRLREAAQLLLVAAEGTADLRPEVRETPDRFARAWMEFLHPEDPDKLGTTFTNVRTDQMVVVSGIRVWSMCEHHLLPFYCDVAIGYITDGARILGLSKFARIARHHAGRLQVQERLVEDIAREVRERTGTENVAVVASGVHLCMALRGVRQSAYMTSSAMSGTFKEAAARAEFLSIVAHHRPEP